MDPVLLAAALVVIAVVVALARLSRRIQKKMAIDAENRHAAMNERMEALFRASFPELQPHFHPRNVFE